MHSSSVLSLNKVTKTFGSLNAVDDVSLKINKGEIYGFLGPNGAGKTTTIRMILDFIRPTTGTVTLFGNNNENGFIESLRGVGYLSADSTLYPNWTAKQHIDFVEKINEVMKNASNESFGYTEEPLVSTDIIGTTYGSIFDATQTLVSKIDDDTYHVQVVAWYDNENSYTSQMVRTIKYFAELGE